MCVWGSQGSVFLWFLGKLEPTTLLAQKGSPWWLYSIFQLSAHPMSTRRPIRPQGSLPSVGPMPETKRGWPRILCNVTPVPEPSLGPPGAICLFQVPFCRYQGSEKEPRPTLGVERGSMRSPKNVKDALSSWGEQGGSLVPPLFPKAAAGASCFHPSLQDL